MAKSIEDVQRESSERYNAKLNIANEAKALSVEPTPTAVGAGSTQQNIDIIINNCGMVLAEVEAYGVQSKREAELVRGWTQTRRFRGVEADTDKMRSYLDTAKKEHGTLKNDMSNFKNILKQQGDATVSMGAVLKDSACIRENLVAFWVMLFDSLTALKNEMVESSPGYKKRITKINSMLKGSQKFIDKLREEPK